VLRVDDELADPGVVAQVDEDEAAVVAAPRRPAGELQPPADVLGVGLAAVDIAVAHSRSSFRRSSSEGSNLTTTSSRSMRRTVASSPAAITVIRAPSRLACVSLPLRDLSA